MSLTHQTVATNNQPVSVLAPTRARVPEPTAATQQRAASNQARQRLLRSGATKANLTVSQPGDRDEREADRVADEVMRTPDSARTGPAGVQRQTPGDSIQRMCTECEEQQVQRQPLKDEEEETIQAKGEAGQIPEITPEVQENLSAIRGSGQPLSESSRAFFEPRFGADFAGVRVHTGVTAAQSARAIRARAFTSGRDIVFANGEYSPGTPKGNHLLAHELTHTIQQEGNGAISSGEPAQVQRAVGFEDLFSDFPFSEPEPSTTNEDTIQDSPDVSFRIFPEGEVPVGEEEAAVQRKPSDETSRSVSPEHEAATETAYPTGMSGGALASALNEGQPLEAGVRSSLESRYGRSLDHVRIHDDADAASLSRRFAARAFTYGNHIAFGEGAYAPKQPEGEQLLRHEVTHVLKSQPSAQGVYRASLCPLTCEPAGALPFVPVSDSTFNCYSYALNSPASKFLLPGQKARTAEFIAMATVLSNPLATTAEKATTLPYFTVAGVKSNTDADIGSAVSSDCNVCCSGSNFKIIEFATDSATKFKRIAGPGGSFKGWQPMVSSSERWDFHWYRKDADGAWSHKHGGRDAQRADESGTTPLCNPCTADRNFGPNYKNVVGSWCI